MKVKIDESLQDLIPSFLQNRNQDVLDLKKAILVSDFVVIRTIGHKMAGTAPGYGFSELGALGVRLEASGNHKDLASARTATQELESYLQALEIEYAPDLLDAA